MEQKPDDFQNTKGDFLNKITKCVKEITLHKHIIITFDQNGLKNDPTSELILKVKGSEIVTLYM